MPKIQRKTQKIFCNSADSDQIAVFGSMSTGNPVYSNDVEQLQSNEAYEIGWDAATLEDKAPFMEEMNGMQYAMSYQLAYTLQTGMPEWDAETEYFANTSFCQVNGVIYQSKTDNNIGNNPTTDSTNWALYGSGNYLNTTQITNCLLEVPQRINLTLSDGTLTLKKGSVVTVPYGTTNRTSEFPIGSQFLNSFWKVVDTQFANNKFFVWAELQSDLSNNRTDVDGKDRFISVYLDGVVNGATSSQSGTSFSNGLGYNTSENTVYWYNTSGVAQGTQLAFPIGIVACGDTYTFGSIKQVFNGFGYCGRTLWLDKDVKLLIGTGREADGTIKNSEITTKLLLKQSHTYTEDRLLLYKKSGELEDIAPRRYLIGLKKDMPTTLSETVLYNYFCTDTLETYWTNGSTTASWQQAEYKTPIAVYGAIKEADGNTITHLTPYQAFRAVDYNEAVVKSDLSEVKVVVETYQNGTSWYRVWSDGWCEQGGFFATESAAQYKVCSFLKPFKDTNYNATTTVYQNKNKDGYAYWVGTVYSYGTNSMTVLIDTNAYYNGVWWRAEGYIA